MGLPTKKTLDKYGLDEKEWMAMFREQGGVCAICKNLPKSGRLCVDHEHAPGWKKMPPAERKAYVRGLLCYICNLFYVGRGMTEAKSKNVTTYLQNYGRRKNNGIF